MDYKKEEITEHFTDFINEQDQEWIESNLDELHHHAFNTNDYLIGTYRCKHWLGTMTFDVINHIKEYEQFNFGEVSTDFSNPEKVVNMYTYIIGEEVVHEWKEKNHYE